MSISAFPLQWPMGWKRTEAHRRLQARFGRASRGSGVTWTAGRSLTVNEAVQRVRQELQRMAVDLQDVVISTNLELRLDGLPRSGQRAPADPGAAVYWRDNFNSAPRVMAIDQYTTVEDNLAAIAATLNAMRAIERHGGAAILERAFTGFSALPAPGAARHWRDVLGVPNTVQNEQGLKDAYRRAASAAHPDKGGSDARMAEVNAAYEQGRAELGFV